MNKKWLQQGLPVLGIGILAWLAVRYLLPLTVPLLLGGVIALAAEPGVRWLQKKLRFPRGGAVGICVSVTLILFAGLLSMLGAATVRELGSAAKLAPAVGQTVGDGLHLLEDWLVGMADRAPDAVRPMLIQTVLNTFQDGTTLVKQVTDKLPSAVANFVGWLSRGALAVGTGVLAGFMISARLPKIKAWLRSRLPETWREKYGLALRGIKRTFGGWLKAQLKLMGVTWAVVSLGFVLLGIPFGPLWAALVALVDSVPVLGTGTVLVPWAIVSFLQKNSLRGIGLLVTYAAAWVLRSVLEPRLVGKSLGIDPLVSLAAFYAGYKLWGVAGMILAPMAAALCKGLTQQFTNNSQGFS